MNEKFTKGYVDTVIRMYIDKEDAKDWLRKRLVAIRNEITEEHFNEMVNYINAK